MIGRCRSTAAKLGLVVEVLRTYLVVRRHAAGRPLPEVVRVLRGTRAGAEGDDADQEAARLGRAVARTLAHAPRRSRCLHQSLVLTALLARRGIDSSIVISVRVDGGFSAHAWVERHGRPLLPSHARDFHRLTAV